MRTVGLVALLLSAQVAYAQVERTQDGDRVGIAIFTGVVAGFGTWVVATPWRGFWHESPDPLHWSAWGSAILVAAASGVMAGVTTPDTRLSAFNEAIVLSFVPAIEAIVLMARAIQSIGADSCNEICHKVFVGLPIFVGLLASFITGQATRAVVGPPTTTMMMAPLTLEF